MRDQKARTEKLRNNIALEEVEVYHVTFGLHTIVAHTHTRNRALSEFCLQMPSMAQKLLKLFERYYYGQCHGSLYFKPTSS